MPTIQRISFPETNQIRVDLEDGRAISMPLDRFPSIQQLTVDQRGQWYVYGNGFSFDDADEIIHIEPILGNFNAYRHEP